QAARVAVAVDGGRRQRERVHDGHGRVSVRAARHPPPRQAATGLARCRAAAVESREPVDGAAESRQHHRVPHAGA
ncbi:hypothetical protein O3G_MSEX000542, partial [Manduca sexta]